MKSTENISFEEALTELEAIVRKIDTGTESLESSIASFERGIFLKNFCEKKLSEARMKIEKITEFRDNVATTTEVIL